MRHVTTMVDGWTVTNYFYAACTKAEQQVRQFIEDRTSSLKTQTLDNLIKEVQVFVDQLPAQTRFRFTISKAKRGQFVGQPQTAWYAMNVSYGPRWFHTVVEPLGIRKHLLTNHEPVIQSPVSQSAPASTSSHS